MHRVISLNEYEVMIMSFLWSGTNFGAIDEIATVLRMDLTRPNEEDKLKRMIRRMIKKGFLVRKEQTKPVGRPIKWKKAYAITDKGHSELVRAFLALEKAGLFECAALEGFVK